MKTLRLSTILAACCVIGTSWAAEPPPAKPPASESAAPKGDEQSKAQEGTKDEEAPAKPKASGKGGSPERFVPSEQVRADFDVSFPIDI